MEQLSRNPLLPPRQWRRLLPYRILESLWARTVFLIFQMTDLLPFLTPRRRRATENAAGWRLYFDADGSGASPHRQLVATLANHPAIGASNLFFVS